MQLNPAAAPKRPHSPIAWVIAVLCGSGFALSADALAQSPPSRDPTNGLAQVPPVVYRSTLSVSPGAAPVGADTWRAANDAVTKIGGWRAYLREAHSPPPSPATGLSPASTPPGGPPATSPATPNAPAVAPSVSPTVATPMPPGHHKH